MRNPFKKPCVKMSASKREFRVNGTPRDVSSMLIACALALIGMGEKKLLVHTAKKLLSFAEGEG